MRRGTRAERERGQALALFAGGLVGILMMTALVIDLGNYWAQQREVQNATDAAAEAGTVILAQMLDAGTTPSVTRSYCPTASSDPWDLAVCESVYGTAAAEGAALTGARYTTAYGMPTSNDVGGGSVPVGAQGIQAFGTRSVATSFARVLNVNTLTVNTQATALTVTPTTYCPPGVTCAILPITVPVNVSNCQNNGMLSPGTAPWPYVTQSGLTAANEAIVPVCKNKNNDIGGASAGSVGWLDITTAAGVQLNPNAPGCSGNGAKNIINQITSTCITGLTLPNWIKTNPGGVGKGGPAVDSAINAYHMQVVGLPLFSGTCDVQPATAPPLNTDGTVNQAAVDAACTAAGGNPQGGVGQNTWYYIGKFLNLTLDGSYLDGSARKSCKQPPGSPLLAGNSSDACFKGWFVDALNPPAGGYQIGPITIKPHQNLSVQLVR